MDPAWTLSRLEQIAIFFGDEKELKNSYWISVR